jgi:hypothetical protein
MSRDFIRRIVYRSFFVLFQEEELQLVYTSDDQTFRIEKILAREKRRDGRVWVLIRWEGYGKDFDTWQLASTVEDIV